LWYDTRYFYMSKDGYVPAHYRLPKKGKYLLLLFGSDGGIFTTLRSPYGKWGDKQMHYQSMIGKEFEVIINAEE